MLGRRSISLATGLTLLTLVGIVLRRLLVIVLMHTVRQSQQRLAVIRLKAFLAFAGMKASMQPIPSLVGAIVPLMSKRELVKPKLLKNRA